MKKDNLLIYYASGLQFVTAIMFFLYPSDTLLVARLGIFQQIFTNIYIGAILLLVASLLPIINIKVKPTQTYVRLSLHFPQLFFLALSELSILNYVLIGQYADGVNRAPQFIFADQLPSTLVGGFYLFALIKRYYAKEETI